MIIETDRQWAFSKMTDEFIDDYQKGRVKEIIKIIKTRGWRTADVQGRLKKIHGTSGHSLTVNDPKAKNGFRIVGFISYDGKGIHVENHEGETDNDESEPVTFSWAEYAKMAISCIEKQEAIEPGKAKARSGTGVNTQKGHEETKMTMLAKTTETRALTLADYEARIHLYKEQGAMAYIGIGRTLTEAKEAGVVPHGQWETWVQEVAGFTPRQAQRCMQVAEKVPEGSAMARLDISKALLLISSGLDEEEQEAIAEKAAREDTTVKALKEELRKAKLQVVQETGAAAEIREELKRIRSERESLENQLKATIESYQKQMDMDEEKYRQQMDEECGKAYQRGVKEKATGLEKEIRKEFQDKIDYINEERARLEEVRKDLTTRLEEAEKGGSARWDEGFQAGQKEAFGLRNELNKQTQYARELTAELEEQTRRAEDLQKDLDAAEEREARKAEQLEALKTEKTQRAMDSARGGVRSETPGALDLAAAVRAFIGAAGILPQMAPQIARMTESERSDISAQVETIAKWVENTRNALLFVAGDGTVD